MKLLNTFALAAVLTLSHAALAAEVAIDCKPPEGLIGNNATITGTLQVTEQAEEYAAVEGVLRVFIGGSSMNPVMNADVKVSGARLDDGSISLASTENDSIAMIYINQNSKDISFVEKDGNQHLSNCAK